MRLFGYSERVSSLLELAPPNFYEDGYDYVVEHGLTKRDIPELIRMAIDNGLWHNFSMFFNEGDDEELNDIYVPAPLHAIRVLVQLDAKQALEPLMSLVCSEFVDILETELEAFYTSFPAKNVLKTFDKYLESGWLGTAPALQFILLIALSYARTNEHDRKTAINFFKKYVQYYTKIGNSTVNAFMCSGLALTSETDFDLILCVFEADEINEDIFSKREFVRYIDFLIRRKYNEDSANKKQLLKVRERTMELIAETSFVMDGTDFDEEFNSVFFELPFFQPDNYLHRLLIKHIEQSESPITLDETIQTLKIFGTSEAFVVISTLVREFALKLEAEQGSVVWFQSCDLAYQLLPGKVGADSEEGLDRKTLAMIHWHTLNHNGKLSETNYYFLCNLAFLSLLRRFGDISAEHLPTIHDAETESYLRRLMIAEATDVREIIDEMFGYEPQSNNPADAKFMMAVRLEMLFKLLEIQSESEEDFALRPPGNQFPHLN